MGYCNEVIETLHGAVCGVFAEGAPGSNLRTEHVTMQPWQCTMSKTWTIVLKRRVLKMLELCCLWLITAIHDNFTSGFAPDGFSIYIFRQVSTNSFGIGMCALHPRAWSGSQHA